MFKFIASAALMLVVMSVESSEAHARTRRRIPPGPVQFIELGHRSVDASVPVVLKLDANAFFILQDSLNGVAQFLPQAPASVLTSDSSAVLKLEGPDSRVQTVRLSGSEVRLPIDPAVGGTYRYHIEWRDRVGRWFLRFPAAEKTFTIEVARPRAR